MILNNFGLIYSRIFLWTKGCFSISDNWYVGQKVVMWFNGEQEFQFLSCLLSVAKGGGLIKPFSVDEVKAVVWDFDSFKSPGREGVNFGFIKEFWHDLKDDITRFVSEFHHNGKLAKGINSTFIALIPKVDSP